ncbi:MAG: class I SAM-dependent methyltransferase [Planctomycetales bacterium]
MGDLNQYLYVRQLAAKLEGPFLEVGSRDYGTTQDLRSLLSQRGRYVGVDMSAGSGVDVVLDLTADFAEVDAALAGERFGTIVCLSVLEHCGQPFRMAENLTKLLKPGGRACISAPFAWKFHGYPSDYWRFTHEGIKKLFPELVFDAADCTASTSRVGGFGPLDEGIGKIPLAPKAHRTAGRPLRALSAQLLKLATKAGALKWLAGYRYVMAPTNVFMTGTRAREADAKAA